MGGAAGGWKRYMPLEVTPIIACMGAVALLATARLYNASRLPDVRFTKAGGLNDWQHKLGEHGEERQERETQQASE